MTDEIKKMLERNVSEWEIQIDNVDGQLAMEPTEIARAKIVVVDKESFDRLKRGFLKLMEQRDCLIDSYYQTHDFRVRQREVDNSALEAAMKGEET